MKFHVLLILFLLLLPGCIREKWVQEGKSPMEEEKDYFDCQNQLMVKYKNFENLKEKEIDFLMNECMRSKGYQDKFKK